MKFLTSFGYGYQIVIAELEDWNDKKPLHSYWIIAPESTKNSWPSIISTALTMLPERYQYLDENTLDIEELVRVCSKLPNQADRRYFIHFAKEQPENLIDKENKGIISRLSLYSSEGIRMLISDFKEELKIAPNKNLEKANMVLVGVLLEKIKSEEELDDLRRDNYSHGF